MKKPKYIKVKRFIPKFVAITLYPIGIIIKEDHAENKVTKNHERIHWEQQQNEGAAKFYFKYVIEWIKHGYRGISYEKEAYNNEKDFNYHPKKEK